MESQQRIRKYLKYPGNFSAYSEGDRKKKGHKPNYFDQITKILMPNSDKVI